MRSGPDADKRATRCMHHRRAQRLARFTHARAYPQNINKCCHSVVAVSVGAKATQARTQQKPPRDEFSHNPWLAMQCAALLHPPKKSCAPMFIVTCVWPFSHLPLKILSHKSARFYAAACKLNARAHVALHAKPINLAGCIYVQPRRAVELTVKLRI